MKERTWAYVLPMIMIMSLLVVPTMAQERGSAATEAGLAAPAPKGPFNSGTPALNGGTLYLTSIDCSNGVFAKYDPASNAWTTLSNYYTHAQMAVSAAGDLYALNCQTQQVEQYDAATDTWLAVMAGPAVSYSHGNLEIANNGEFLYVEADDPNLYYTTGGSWSNMPLPFEPNNMGDYDPTTGQFVLGERSTTNAHLIDAFGSWSISDFYSPISNGEWARFGSILDGRYFFEAGGSPIHSFDLSLPGSPPFDHGVVPGWYNSSAADRGNHVIYTASLNGDTLSAFDPATNSLIPLAGYMNIGNHSTLAYAAPAAGPPKIFATHVRILHLPGPGLLLGIVRIVDEGLAPVTGATVQVEWTLPIGGGYVFPQTRMTNANGLAFPIMLANWPGTYVLDLVDVTAVGYVYDPGMNWESSGTITLP